MLEYKLIRSQVLFDNPYARVILDTLEYGGVERPYFYLTSPVDAVATVSLTDARMHYPDPPVPSSCGKGDL